MKAKELKTLTQSLIGLPQEEARQKVQAAGLDFRLDRYNDIELAHEPGYKFGRVSVSVVNNVVTSVDVDLHPTSLTNKALEALAASLVGMSLDAAQEKVDVTGHTLRFGSVNGDPQFLIDNHKVGRITADLVLGKIAAATVETNQFEGVGLKDFRVKVKAGLCGSPFPVPARLLTAS